MKQIIIFVLAFLPAVIQAQEYPPQETQNGYFILLGEEVPYDFAYRISRKEGDEDFEIVDEIRIPNSRAAYEQKLKESHALFPLLPMPIELQINRVWEIANNPQNDELLHVVHPVIENLALGRAVSDTAVQVGRVYQYKIDKVVAGEVISSRLTDKKTYFQPREVILPKATYLKHTLFGNDIISQWLLIGNVGLAGFEVFRRDNLRGDFRKISISTKFRQNMDSTFVHVKDTTANQFEVYEYKLLPFDHYGNPGTFTSIAKIGNFTKHDFPVLEKFKAIALDNRQVKIQWQMEYKPFIRSIKILRSMSFDTDFVEIAEVSPSDSSFVDVLPISMENYYYRLRINGPDEVDVTSSSIFILYESDLVPEPPTRVGARANEGGVDLIWEDRKRNIFGYYVYRRYGNDGFAQISDPVLRDSTGIYHFTDSAQNLRGDRFYDYAIKSISDSYVLSPFSDTVTTRPGIAVSIASPRNLRGRKADSKVHLFWDDLSAVDGNLMGYKVYRKKSFEEDFQVLNDSLLNARTNHFTDSLIEQGYSYDYAVRAYNYFGGQSAFSDSIKFDFYLPMPSPPAGVKAQKTSEGIRIVWGKTLVGELNGYNLYKYTPDQEPQLLTQLSSDQDHFLDDKVTRGQLYFYYVTSKNDQQIEGRPSKVVSLRY